MRNRARVIMASSAALALVAIGLGASSAQSVAAPASSPPVTLSPAAASDLALRSGVAVEVSSLTSPTEITSANPDGTFTVTTSILPQRVRSGGMWVPTDDTLKTNADGTLSPIATLGSLVLSGGGSGPLATMDRNGHTLSISFPVSLPSPTVTGNVATYLNIYPDIDLQITSNITGGFSEILVVRTPAAARNPAIRTLRFAYSSGDLSLASDAQGALHARDGSGRDWFSAPTPRMWDSTPGSTSLTVSKNPSPGDAQEGYSIGAIAVGVDARGISITPDATYLNASQRNFPLFIDPAVTTVTTQSFDEVQQGCPTTSNWNSTTYGTPAAGYNSASGCIGIERSYFQFAFPTVVQTTHVISASVALDENYSGSCSSSNAVTMYPTGKISASTTWNAQPTKVSGYAGVANTYSAVGASKCGAAASETHNYTMTTYVQAQATAKASTATFGIFGQETSGTYFRRFAANPKLTINYNHPPMTPSLLSTTPTPINGNSSDLCGVATPYGYIGNSQVTLRAIVGDVDGASLNVSFWVSGPAPYGTKTLTYTQVVPASPTASTAVMSAPQTLNSGTYTWKVQTSDGQDTSAWSPICHFVMDTSAPQTTPIVTSTDYPAEVTLKARGTPGTFSFGPNSATGIKSYKYSLNGGAPQMVAADSSGNWKGLITPPRLGPNNLDVKSVDIAGNISSSTVYSFSTGRASVPDKPGDFNADGIPDVIGVWATSPNALTLYIGSKTGLFAGQQTVGNSGWLNALTSHGDFNGDTAQDLLARLSDGNLWYYPGTADGSTFDPNQRIQIGYPNDPNNPLPADAPASWSTASQLLSIGDLTQPNTPGLADGLPDVLAVVGDKLWLYPISNGQASNPELISSQGWTNKTITPGDLQNGTPSLLVRDNTSGTIVLSVGEVDAALQITYPGSANATNVTVTNGTFPAATYPLIAGADVNGDGQPDLHLTKSDGTNQYVSSTVTTTTTPWTATWSASTKSGTSGWNNIFNIS